MRAGLGGIALVGMVAAGCTGNIGSQADAPESGAPPNEGPGEQTEPGPGGTDPEALDGLGHWAARCVNCHGNFAPGSAISAGNGNGDFRLDATAALQRHGDGLEAYIASAMPLDAPDVCTGDCAQATGQLIRARVMPDSTPVDCTGSETTYGLRQLALLDSREYQQSLEDLLGVQQDYGHRVANNDGYRGGFTNMTGKSLSGTLLDIYVANAEDIAAWAVTNDRPFACASNCGPRFVDEFLFRAFRGPVSEAQRTQYLALFQANPQDGMRLALEAALTSPYFLYRIEAGVDLQSALEQGYYEPGAQAPNDPPGDGQLIPAGPPTDELLAANVPGGSNGRLENGVWAMFQNGRVRFAFQHPLTDPSIIEVVARGSNHGAQWPNLTVRVGNTVVGTRTVDTPDLQTYRFEVHGVEGIEWVELEFNNDSGVPPYNSGQDVNLFIERATLYAGTSVGPVAQDPPPDPPSTPPSTDGLLTGVDSAAFVLSPYELASVLGFMLTGSTPDAALLDAARRGQLASRAQIRAQVERLIDSPRGRAHVGRFVTRWFGLDALADTARPDVPEFTDAVKAAMVEEVRAHFAHVFYGDDVPYADFFGGDYTFLNRTLAEFYGVQGNFGDAFVRTPVEGRGGPLASGGFMTVNAHVERTAPILRAVRAREMALCHYIDPPNSPIAGEDIDEQRAAAQARVEAQQAQDGLLSSRDFYYLYTDGIDACAGCHETIINPMFGMEDFDNVGRRRAAAGPGLVYETIGDQQVPVSIEGTLVGVASTSDPTTLIYAGAKDLSNQLAQTEAINTCLIRRSFRFLTGLTYVDRDLDTAARETLTAEQRNSYACVASRMRAAFDSANQSPRAMFIELATESLLLLRR